MFWRILFCVYSSRSVESISQASRALFTFKCMPDILNHSGMISMWNSFFPRPCQLGVGKVMVINISLIQPSLTGVKEISSGFSNYWCVLLINYALSAAFTDRIVSGCSCDILSPAYQNVCPGAMPVPFSMTDTTSWMFMPPPCRTVSLVISPYDREHFLSPSVYST